MSPGKRAATLTVARSRREARASLIPPLEEKTMNTTHLWRSLIAATTAIACLLGLSNPAGAVLHAHGITGGEITLTKTGVTEVIDLTPGTGTSCGGGTLEVDETTTTVIVTTLTASGVRTFSTTGTFLVVLTRGTFSNSAGSLNSAANPHIIDSSRSSIVATVYNTTSCTPTGTPICTLAAVVHLAGTSTSTGVSATFTGTSTSVGTVAAFPTCTAGPSYLIGTSSATTVPITSHRGSS